MNSIKGKKFFSVLLMSLMITACVQDDSFEIPPLAVEDPMIPITSKIGIGAVLGSLAQAQAADDDPNAMVTFDVPDQYLEGYIISSDKAGNFFEELIIQDAKKNPTAGIRVLIDINPLYTSYEFGRKVYLKLDGLSAGIENGVPSLGILGQNEVGQIPSFYQKDVIIRSPEVATITPLAIDFEDFSNDMLHLFIKINNIQFNKEEVLGNTPHTFAAEPDDEYDGERIIENCALGYSSILSTSTFADFKGLLLPTAKGSIEGILTKNYFGDTFNVVINDPAALVFDTPERCDFSCDVVAEIGTNTLFHDDFETQTNRSLISGNGWTNYSQEGTETWEAYKGTDINPSSGIISARVRLYNSEDDKTIAWLITPPINLDAQEGETLSFETSNSFADASELDVVFSRDWDGNPDTIMTASWNSVLDAYIVQNADDYAVWYPSGNINLSCESGTIYIAFRYHGSRDEGFGGAYELDNIKVSYTK